MLIKEFISETNKNQMISTLFKYYKVQNIKVKHKVMKRHANYEVEDGILYLSTKYKTIKKSQIKEFLITIIHEIDHAMMAKKHGWRKFRDMWEFEANKIEQGFVKGATDAYWDNPYEIQAEKFGQKNWKKWHSTIKKQGLF